MSRSVRSDRIVAAQAAGTVVELAARLMSLERSLFYRVQANYGASGYPGENREKRVDNTSGFCGSKFCNVLGEALSASIYYLIVKTDGMVSAMSSVCCPRWRTQEKGDRPVIKRRRQLEKGRKEESGKDYGDGDLARKRVGGARAGD